MQCTYFLAVVMSSAGLTSVHIIAKGLRGAEEDFLVFFLPQSLPVKPFAAARQFLNVSLQSTQSGSCMIGAVMVHFKHS